MVRRYLAWLVNTCVNMFNDNDKGLSAASRHNLQFTYVQSQPSKNSVQSQPSLINSPKVQRSFDAQKGPPPRLGRPSTASSASCPCDPLVSRNETIKLNLAMMRAIGMTRPSLPSRNHCRIASELFLSFFLADFVLARGRTRVSVYLVGQLRTKQMSCTNSANKSMA